MAQKVRRGGKGEETGGTQSTVSFSFTLLFAFSDLSVAFVVFFVFLFYFLFDSLFPIH
jgi:predicted PurR-regulated permease PerM